MSIELKILSINRYVFIFGFIFLAILIMALMIGVIEILDVELSGKQVEEKTIWYFVGALLLAPIIETYIFQKLPIDFLRDSFSDDWPLTLISAIPFGLIHYLQQHLVRDIFYAFCIGGVYAYAYILAKKRDDLSAYWAVVFIHAGYNISAVIIHLLVD